MSFLSSIGNVAKNLVGGVPIIGSLVNGPNQVDPQAAAQAAAATKRAQDTADQAYRDLQAAQQRHTEPGQVDASTAAPVTVGPATTQAPVTVGTAGTVQAPDVGTTPTATAAHAETPVDVGTLGNAVRGTTDAAQAVTPYFAPGQGGLGYQNAAALALQGIVAGTAPSPAEMQLREAQDRGAAEQESIAAGARGESVASARRNAATNIANSDIDFGGKMAELRAQEQQQAIGALGQVGGQIQGETTQIATTGAQLQQQTQLANQQALNTAIQGAQQRYANGEITQAQLETEIGKANADYQQQAALQTQQLQQQSKLTGAQLELQAGLQNDQDLQQSLTLQAQLQQRAAEGDQQAQTQLTALQGQIDSQIRQFNGKQIQDANSQNITNRLQAMQMDNQYVESVRQAWVTAEANGDQTALDALKTQVQRDVDQASQNASWKTQFQKEIQDVTKAAATAFAPGAGGSDRRLKTDVQVVNGPDVDGFLRAVGKTQTWQYKDPKENRAFGGGEGRRMGPMAQDMAGDKLGASAVGVRPDGKMSLDYQQLAALALAGLGRLNERLEKVEGTGGKGKKPRPLDVEGFLRLHKIGPGPKEAR